MPSVRFLSLRSRFEASPFSDRRRSDRRRPDRRICVTTAPRGRHTVKTAFFHRLSLEALVCWTTLFNISARQKKGFCERNDSSRGGSAPAGSKSLSLTSARLSNYQRKFTPS